MSTKYALPLASLLIGGCLSTAATYMVRRRSIRRGFVDRPGGHKAHEQSVALGGGLAVTLATTLPILGAILLALASAGQSPAWLPDTIGIHLGGIRTRAPMGLAIVGCAWFMCGIGLADDRKPISAGIKFAIQLLVAGLLVVGFNLRLLSSLGYVPSVLLSMLWIVTLTNSFNFLDNMDGLASGVGIIVACLFGTAALAAGQIFVPACAFLLAGALAGFLPFNLYPASIFLGDAGSLVLGLLLSVFTILTTFADPAHGQSPLGVVAPLVVMAVPLYDTLSVTLLRWRLGEPLWKGDRRHFSHRLLRRGLPVRKAVLIIWLATLVTGLPALLLPGAEWSMAWIILLQTLLVVALVALLESDPPHEKTP